MPTLVEIAEQIKSDENKKRIKGDMERFLVYNGQIREPLIEIIKTQFKKKNTVVGLINSIVPINITMRIVDALAALYMQSPIREPKTESESDQELINVYSQAMRVNTQMKYANRMFKLHKHVLLQPFLNSKGIPKLRIYPSQTFSLFSTNLIEPNIPTIVVIHLITDRLDPKQNRFAYWDEQNHFIINGDGEIVQAEMIAMDNEEGINPFGKLPFVHISESEFSIYPIRNDDLINVQFQIDKKLSDLSYGIMFQSFSTMVVKGAEKQDFPVGPADIIFLPRDQNGDLPDVDSFKPEIDIEDVLKFVESLVGLLLSTNNLSVGEVSTKLEAGAGTSGISKMLDKVVSTEDRQDQISFFRDAEIELWDLFAHFMLPIWVESGQIDPEFTGVFQTDFELFIKYPSVKPFISEKERIEIAKMKFEMGFISLEGALKEINPDIEPEKVQEIINDIRKERLDNVSFFERNNGTQESQG